MDLRNEASDIGKKAHEDFIKRQNAERRAKGLEEIREKSDDDNDVVEDKEGHRRRRSSVKALEKSEVFHATKEDHYTREVSKLSPVSRG